MRLIDADALDKRIYNDIPIKVFGSIKNMAAVRQIIEEAPTVDAVPVVRCKDCKHYYEGDPEHPDCGWCRRLICGTVAPDFYCADGERKDDESEN